MAPFSLFFSHAYAQKAAFDILEARVCTWWVWDSQECLPQFIPLSVSLIASPCKNRKGLHYASFLKGVKDLIIPVGQMLLAKDKETPCKKARCTKADFPSQEVADWRWAAQHSTRGFAKIRGNTGEHAADYGEKGRATAGEPFAHGNKTSCLLLPQFLFINLLKPLKKKKKKNWAHFLTSDSWSWGFSWSVPLWKLLEAV